MQPICNRVFASGWAADLEASPAPFFTEHITETSSLFGVSNSGAITMASLEGRGLIIMQVGATLPHANQVLVVSESGEWSYPPSIPCPSYTLPEKGRSWVVVANAIVADRFFPDELAHRVLQLGTQGWFPNEMSEALVEETGDLRAAVCVALMDPTPIIHVKMPVTEGGTFSCCLTADQALKFAVESRGKGLGFTLAAGVLKSTVPMGLGPAERLIRGL